MNFHLYEKKKNNCQASDGVTDCHDIRYTGDTINMIKAIYMGDNTSSCNFHSKGTAFELNAHIITYHFALLTKPRVEHS